jgi:hypothetical protein
MFSFVSYVIYHFKPGVVAPTAIPVTWEVEIRRIMVPDLPGQKSHTIPCQPIAGFLSSQLWWEVKIGGPWSRLVWA